MSSNETTAAAMGRRAGEAFLSTGVPTPNPFRGPAGEHRVDQLAAAWRRAYFAVVRAARRG